MKLTGAFYNVEAQKHGREPARRLRLLCLWRPKVAKTHRIYLMIIWYPIAPGMYNAHCTFMSVGEPDYMIPRWLHILLTFKIQNSAEINLQLCWFRKNPLPEFRESRNSPKKDEEKENEAKIGTESKVDYKRSLFGQLTKSQVKCN